MDARGQDETAIVVVIDGVEVAVWPVEHACRCDLLVVDALARMRLEAKQLGGSVYVRNPSGALRGLLDLVGLSDVLLR